MTKYILNICAIAALIFLGSCQKDTEEFIPDASVSVSGNDIFGVVIDENDNAVQGALAVLDGRSVITNEYGIYKFTDVTLNSRHNFINITKDGYFEGARTFRVNESTKINHTTQLLRKKFTNEFNSSSGGSVEQGSIQIEFPAGSIVIDSNEADYEGTVQVAIQYLDPTNNNIIRRMPGDMSAIDLEGQFVTLSSFGMAYVELQSPNGEKLQLKEGMKATMTGKIPEANLDAAPESIAMWVFDDTNGLWKEEGSAQKVGDTYVGEVAHFSAWNYDGPARTIILCGRIVDQSGNGVGGVHVWVATPAFFAVGHGNTNPDGTFCGAVTLGETLTLEIQNVAGCNEPIFLGEIGPFTTDTNLGDIPITINNANNVSVSGMAVNCDGNSVTNGVLILDNQYIEITDGNFTASLIRCDVDAPFNVKVVDLEALTESETLSLSGPGPHTLGVVSACGTEIFRMEMNIDDLGINHVGLFELFAYSSDSMNVNQKTLIGFHAEDNDESANIRVTYDDNQANGFAEGNFPIASLFYFSFTNPNGESEFEFLNGDINITEYNDVEKYIRGNYSAQVRRLIEQTEHTLYGNFKLNTN
jgi:hypothetical protein